MSDIIDRDLLLTLSHEFTMWDIDLVTSFP